MRTDQGNIQGADDKDGVEAQGVTVDTNINSMKEVRRHYQHQHQERVPENGGWNDIEAVEPSSKFPPNANPMTIPNVSSSKRV